MKRTSIQGILVAIATMLALVLVPGPAWASAGALGASSYTSNGADISGWNWVRGAGQTATWTFDVAGLATAKPRSVYLNVSALVTNGVSGGSGYSAYSVKFDVACETGRQLLSVKLTNPFKPMDPADSGGLGYAAYGASSSFLQTEKFAGCSAITVTAAYPFTSGRHVAFNQQSAILGFLS
ncbi:MAG: hypothetical protein IPO93_10585 [Actinobacteria bacterium]|nr:hypothetical protein [Actinomycetota bacterium]